MFKHYRRLVIPKRILKHKPQHITHLVIPLPPSLATDLRQWITDTDRKADDRLVNVPTRCNYIREHKARLKLANIPYQTADGYADIHAFRTTANQYLKRNNVPLQTRQRFLRHAAKDITTKHYDPDNRRPVIMSRRVFALLSQLDNAVRHPNS
jgi:integrase